MKKKYLLIIGIIVLLFNIDFNNNVIADCNEGYSKYDFDYYRSITIESDYIYENLTNYPIFIDMPSQVFGKSGEGLEMLFMDSTNTTSFSYELDEYWVDPEGGGDYYGLWVNVTNISKDSDTIFYVYYGNSDLADGQCINDVWNSHYKMVNHFNDKNKAYLEDSTQYGNHLGYGTEGTRNLQDGKLGNAIELSGVSQYCFSTAYDDSINIEEKTFVCWIEPDVLGEWDRIITKDIEGGENWGVVFYDGEILYDEDATANIYYGSSALSQNVWQMITVSAPVTESNVNIYYDMGQETIRTKADNIGSVSNPRGFTVGARQTHTSNYYDGRIDEMWVLDEEMSWEWVNSTFHNTNQTTGFITVGSETSVGSPSDTLIDSYYYNESKDHGEVGIDDSWINFTMNIYYNSGNDTYWYVLESFDTNFNNELYVDFVDNSDPYGVEKVRIPVGNLFYAFANDTFYYTDSEGRSELQFGSFYRNYTGGDSLTGYSWINASSDNNYQYDPEGGFSADFFDAHFNTLVNSTYSGGCNGTVWYNVTYNTSNKNKGVTVNTSYTKDNDSWTQNATVGEDDWLFMSGLELEENTIIIFLVIFLLSLGHTIKKKMGGIYIAISGSLLISLIFVSDFSTSFKSLLVVLGCFIILIGTHKIYYQDNKKEEGE